ncbi:MULTISPECIES: DUF4123 domain-containing protein [unclassified Acinetobacter]|uniref:DUF4123 domain-containing protein n=1 Tax=unclassified Acinetobacter TaxID=196816 RepID=UPI0015D436E6|nr:MULTISPECIES: DUF4123 domain-containing protein [unclassified Acinetobacter]UUS56566.1 DUF4123 domain-containing protein [Acinetobacter sp. YH16040_T]
MNSTKLFEQIAKSDSENNFFLLLDTAKNYLFIRRWLKKLSFKKLKQIGNLFEGTIDETSPLEVSPLLIPIHFETKDELNKQFLIEENIGMFSVLETPLSKHELIQHLQPFLQAELPTGELALFRFYDPFIIQVLNQMLNEQEYSDLLKPITNWWVQQMDNTFLNLESHCYAD